MCCSSGRGGDEGEGSTEGIFGCWAVWRECCVLGTGGMRYRRLPGRLGNVGKHRTVSSGCGIRRQRWDVGHGRWAVHDSARVKG